MLLLHDDCLENVRIQYSMILPTVVEALLYIYGRVWMSQETKNKKLNTVQNIVNSMREDIARQLVRNG